MDTQEQNHNPEEIATDLLVRFSRCLQELADLHDMSSTIAAMRRFKVFSEEESLEDLEDFDFGNAPINEVLGLARGLVPAIATGVKNVAKKVSKTGIKVAGTAGAVGAAGGLKALDKAVDQDVSIADITTREPLNIVAPSIEKLLVQTQQMLQNLTSVLGAGMKELDTSIDYNTAAGTGNTLAQIQGQQATGFASNKGEENQSPTAKRRAAAESGGTPIADRKK